VKLPWAEPGGRFTLFFERLAIDWLKAASQKAVAALLGLSWDEIHGIMDRAVKRGLLRRKAETLTYIGVDEKSFRKGHQYFTIVNDIDRSRVLYVAEDRKETSLDGFWPTLSPQQRDGIQGVAMDMWEPYVNSVRKHIDDAGEKIVFDKFHIASHLGEAVDKVRREENRILLEQDDRTLVGTKYQWLRRPANFTRAAWRSFKALRDSNLKTARAWALKVSGMALFDYVYDGAARQYFKWWYRWATHSRLEPMVRAAKMIHSRFDNVLTYLKHRITNATSESINSKIQWVKYTARGFRNRQNFKTAIYFHCGGLDMAPSST